MKAVQFSEFGGPDVLEIVELPDPHPAAGQVRVRVRAAGINPIDWKVRSGAMGGDLPQTTGREVAGVVDEVGEAVTDVKVGDEVFGFADGGGGAAELALSSEYAPIPPSLDFAQAAALPVAVETAVRTLDALGVGSGTTVLINGAAGGVGSAAVQIARARGARVIGTASEQNHEYLRSLGAEPTTYGEGMVERVRALAPDGVDLAFDTAGKGGIPDLIALTGDPARVATIADFGAAALGVKVTGGAEGRAPGALDEAARLVDAGRLHVPVQQTFTFAEAPEAH